MKFVTRTFVSFIPLAVAITLLCGLLYTAVQQNYRQSLNDPQIQVAEDAAAYLNTSTRPDIEKAIPVGNTPIDIATSLSPWMGLFNPDGTMLIHQISSNGFYDASSGMIADWDRPDPPVYEFPQIPTGVLLAASGNRGKDTSQPYENRVSWQLNSNVRQAIVVVAVTNGPYRGDFVVAGRNMREVEQREQNLSIMIVIGWILTLLASLLAKAFVRYVE